MYIFITAQSKLFCTLVDRCVCAECLAQCIQMDHDVQITNRAHCIRAHANFKCAHFHSYANDSSPRELFAICGAPATTTRIIVVSHNARGKHVEHITYITHTQSMENSAAAPNEYIRSECVEQ